MLFRSKSIIRTLAELSSRDKNVIRTLAELSSRDKNVIRTLTELSLRDKNAIRTLTELSSRDKNAIRTLTELSSRNKSKNINTLIQKHRIMLIRKLQYFPFGRLSNNNALQTFDRMAEVYAKLDILQLAAFLDGFVGMKTQLSESLRPHTGSAITRRLEVQDPERIRLYNQFHGISRNGMKAHDPEVSNAANEIDVILKRNGSPAAQQRDERTRTIAKIVRDLNTAKMQVFVKTIPGAESVLASLEDLNDEFARDYNDRIEERVGQEKGATTKLRSEVNDAATLSLEAINAYGLLFIDNTIQGFVDELNTILDQARTNLSNRGKGSGGSKKPDDTDPETPDIEDPDPDSPIEIRDRSKRDEEPTDEE